MGSCHQGGTFTSLVNTIVTLLESMSREKLHVSKSGGEIWRGKVRGWEERQETGCWIYGTKG